MCGSTEPDGRALAPSSSERTGEPTRLSKCVCVFNLRIHKIEKKGAPEPRPLPCPGCQCPDAPEVVYAIMQGGVPEGSLDAGAEYEPGRFSGAALFVFEH